MKQNNSNPAILDSLKVETRKNCSIHLLSFIMTVKSFKHTLDMYCVSKCHTHKSAIKINFAFTDPWV